MPFWIWEGEGEGMMHIFEWIGGGGNGCMNSDNILENQYDIWDLFEHDNEFYSCFYEALQISIHAHKLVPPLGWLT